LGRVKEPRPRESLHFYLNEDLPQIELGFEEN
jgi:hypothetical protein